jgi:sugar phosphate isomerase/epimerase
MLAISNIAWRPEERAAVYAMLAETGVRGLEIAPGRAFPNEPDPVAPSFLAIEGFLREMARRNLKLVSMQSLLFGLNEARLFGSEPQRECFEVGLSRAVTLAGQLAIPNLVMGSPTNRAIPDSMSSATAEDIAIGVFRRIGDLCLKVKAKLALEPNPAAYGTNFLTTIGETLAFVQRLDHPAVGVNFDIGSLHMNGERENGGEWFAKVGAFVSHVHISEPHLAPAPRDERDFEELARQILAQRYDGWFSIEMRAVGDDNLACVRESLTSCARALAKAKHHES